MSATRSHARPSVDVQKTARGVRRPCSSDPAAMKPCLVATTALSSPRSGPSVGAAVRDQRTPSADHQAAGAPLTVPTATAADLLVATPQATEPSPPGKSERRVQERPSGEDHAIALGPVASRT